MAICSVSLLVRFGVRHNGVVGLVCQCFVVFKCMFMFKGFGFAPVANFGLVTIFLFSLSSCGVYGRICKVVGVGFRCFSAAFRRSAP